MTDINADKKEKKVRAKTVFCSFLLILAGIVFIAGAMIYGFGADNKFTKYVLRYIPFPAGALNYRTFVSISELKNNVESVRKFYESQDFSKVNLRVDFTTEDGKKRLKIRERQIFNKMLEDKIIEMLAGENGIKLTNDLISQAMERKMDEYGSRENVKLRLERLYGWTLDDFEKKIVRPSLYREELEKKINSRENNDQAGEKIKKAEDELGNKKSFSDVARDFSEGSTAQKGGELGWFGKDHLIPALASKVFSMKKSETSDIIESELGFHIVLLEDIKKEGGNDLVKISQIFVRKNMFFEWLKNQAKNYKIAVLLKDYYWDKEKQEAQFRDNNLRSFEEKIKNEFQGDASLAF